VVISFLSDFGLDDDFVGVCHGVIARIAPDAQVIDVTHGIAPQAVLQGAVVLASSLPYVPEGVHLAVVDPGVGSDRRAVAVRDREGRVFLGPDNGLLVPAAERGGIEGAWALENAAYRLERVSRTFHGRDVFAPAAAYIATGVMPEELGPALEPASLVRLELPPAEIREGEIRTMVLLVDRFGNAQLNVVAADLERAGIAPGAQVEIGDHSATVARTFADAPSGGLLLYEDAYGRLALAMAGGNAAETLSIRVGDELTIART
jgi:S-adenosyl-L-methionine hydrolase (adenosine-forming)